MATRREYLNFILEQIADLDEVSCRAMMGEYILYYKGKIVGGIYDDRLLVKPVPSAVRYVASPIYAVPYNGAKEMLLIEEVDDRAFLCGLLKAMVEELPSPKPRRR